MALEVKGGVLTASIQAILEKLDSPEVVEFLRRSPSRLHQFKTHLVEASEVLNVAEGMSMRNYNNGARRWLERLEEAIYVAGDLVDQIRTEATTKRDKIDEAGWRSYIPTTSSISSFDRQMEEALTDVFKEIEDIAIEAHQSRFLRLREVGNEYWRAWMAETCSLLNFSVYGRDSEKELLVDFLVSGDEAAAGETWVIPIVGMGGLGKTTLAQLVYKDNRVREHFDLMAWVHVSDEFDVFRLTNMILERVTFSTQSDNLDPPPLEEVQYRLREALREKKFLIFLDDVWNEDRSQWDEFMRPFHSGSSKGSKMLVTTRNEGVALVVQTVPSFHLKTLPEECCWQIFAKLAFHSSGLASRPDLVKIGRKIVAKCKGVPLAVKWFAEILRLSHNVGEWEKILRCELWEMPEMQSSVLQPLWLSYYHLPPDLKGCFAYCSIFPKGYEFEKEMLISLWMSEDLLRPNQRNTTVEEAGEEYFRELTSRSLFQKPSGAHRGFTMHNLVNDLATFVSRDFGTRLDDSRSRPVSKTRRLLFERQNVSNARMSAFLTEARNLRAFLPFSGSWDEEVNEWNRTTMLELLVKLSFLRALSLRNHSIENLPDSLGKLRLLRYLDLSQNDIEVIPDSVSTLCNLQTLLLSNCKRLTRLPSDMGKLIKLRRLDVKGTPLKEMPPHMGNITDLQPLSNFVLGRQCATSNIKELRRLEQLRGELCISGLENIGDGIASESEANYMTNKNYLSEVSLIWDDSVNAEDSNREREVLEKLRPNMNLKKLWVHSYRGTSFPDWVASCSFSHMTFMYFGNCKSCFLLPPLWQLPSLKELYIIGFDAVVEFSGDMPPSDSSFRSLESLTFQDMSNWERWTFHQESAFPRLKTLVLKNCPRLLIRSLPNVIETLEIEKCPKLELFPSEQTFETLESLKVTESCDSMTSFALAAASPHLKKLQLSCSKLTVDILITINSLSLSGWYASLVYLNMHGGTSTFATSFPLGHLPSLQTLHLSHFLNLESFDGQVFSCLEDLNLALCPKLNVQFGDRFPALTGLKISFCCKQEPFSGLENLNKLDISTCDAIFSSLVRSGLRSFTSLRSLSIKGYEDELDSYPVKAFLPTTLTSLQIFGLLKLKALNGTAFRQLTCLESLRIVGCAEIGLLPEDDLPASLSRLSIEYCPSLKKTYYKESGERWSKISHIDKVRIL